MDAIILAPVAGAMVVSACEARTARAGRVSGWALKSGVVGGNMCNAACGRWCPDVTRLWVAVGCARIGQAKCHRVVHLTRKSHAHTAALDVHGFAFWWGLVVRPIKPTLASERVYLLLGTWNRLPPSTQVESLAE